MTDEELIARLRKADEYEPLGHDGWEAADRIEALRAQIAFTATDGQRLLRKTDVIGVCDDPDSCFYSEGSVARCGPCAMKIAARDGVTLNEYTRSNPQAMRLQRELSAAEAEVSALQAEIVTLKEREEKLRELLREARADLEYYVTHEYPKHLHPYYERQWNRDMELCRRIDAALPAVTVGVKPDRDTFDAMCAMRNSINEHVPMPSLESDLLQGPENSVFCATVAEAVINEVTRLRSMTNGARVKRLEWHNFDAWTHWAEGACGTYHIEERNGYWQVELRVGGLVHGVTETGDTTPEDLDAAKAAAQADYEARIRAALEPVPTAGQRLIAAAAEASAIARGEKQPAAVYVPDAAAIREAWEKSYWRLRSYAVHDNDCKLNKPPRFDGPCSCGLTAALEEALTLLEKPHDRA